MTISPTAKTHLSPKKEKGSRYYSLVIGNPGVLFRKNLDSGIHGNERTGGIFKPPSKVIYCLMGLAFLLPVVSGCNYGRMNEQESVRTYETTIPEMPPETIPVTGGVQTLRAADPQNLKNPLPDSEESVNQGGQAYSFFCVHCHGPKGDGNGTVGQSFYPLSSDLTSPYVQEQRDGVLFSKISLGYRRHPPLADTMSTEDRWAVILYLRSFTRKPES